MAIKKIRNSNEVKGLHQSKILIVDDDPDVLDSMKDVVELEMGDCLVSVASNTEQAKLLAQQIKPDVALLDIKLGQDSGLDLISELKSINSDIECVMMTAYRDNKYTVAAVRSGASDYLYKPVKPHELIQTITRLLQHQRIQREVIKAEKRFHTIFEQSTQWLFLLDVDGKLLDANETAIEFIAESKDRIINGDFWASQWFVSSVDAQEIIQAGLSKVSSGELFNREIIIHNMNNDSRTFDLYMKPVFDHEGVVFQIIIECRDISDRKKAEEDIKQLNAELELRVKERTNKLEQSLILLTAENKERKRAEEQAEKASKAKTSFLSHMSHELRTPLNAILGFGQLLELDSDEMNESQQEYIEDMLNAGNHLLNLITEVLDLTEIESGTLKVVMDEVSLDDVVKECASYITPLAEARDLKQTDNISGKGYILRADYDRLKQVLSNLLSNAVKYNSDNGTITMDSEVIDKHRLRISITDTGEGITKEDKDKLFGSFERLNTRFNVDGIGIGLVITKSLIELMGGTIGVESEADKGSMFWIELNLANEKLR